MDPAALMAPLATVLGLLGLCYAWGSGGGPRGSSVSPGLRQRNDPVEA